MPMHESRSVTAISKTAVPGLRVWASCFLEPAYIDLGLPVSYHSAH